MKRYFVYQPTLWPGVPDELIGIYDTEEEAEAEKNACCVDLGRYIEAVGEDEDEDKYKLIRGISRVLYEYADED